MMVVRIDLYFEAMLEKVGGGMELKAPVLIAVDTGSSKSRCRKVHFDA